MESKVCVIGLGYVGLPLAMLCSKKGYETYGIDIDENKLKLIEKGINPIDNSRMENKVKIGGYGSTKESGVIVLCLPTPVNRDNSPDLKPLLGAAERIARNLQKGQLVIIESTVAPGIIDNSIKPILESSGLKAGIDFYLAHCPERVDPGNKEWGVDNIPRVIGAVSSEGLERAYDFYKSILSGEIKKLSSIKAVEAVKVLENSFRDVNIAFINEIAQSFDKMGIDVKEVIEGALTKPFAFMPHYPGCGVGGHCIPVDPYYLIEKAKEAGFEHKFLKLAREINNYMPVYTVNLMVDCINKFGGSIENSKVGVLGVAYKAGIADSRESPALKIIDLLKERGAEVFVYDPYIRKYSNVESSDELMQKSDYLIIATDHKEFKDIPIDSFLKFGIKAIVDGKNCLDKEGIIGKGIVYKGVGR